MKLSSIQIIALAKMLDKKTVAAAREQLSVGVYEVDFDTNTSGTFEVFADFEKRQTNTIDWMGLFALAMSKLNGTTVEAVVNEYEESGVDKGDIKDTVQGKVDNLRAKTYKTNKGQVRTAITYDLVEVEVEAPAKAKADKVNV